MNRLRRFVYFTALGLLNHGVNHLPFFGLRHFFYRLYRLKLGKRATLHRDIVVFAPARIEIGDGTSVHFGTLLDGRGGLKIAEDVDVSFYVRILTEEHDPKTSNYGTRRAPVVIERHASIGTGSIVLPGVTLGEGSVVAAGAVVTKDVPAFTIVAGVPARVIGDRARDLDYRVAFRRPFH